MKYAPIDYHFFRCKSSDYFFKNREYFGNDKGANSNSFKIVLFVSMGIIMERKAPF